MIFQDFIPLNTAFKLMKDKLEINHAKDYVLSMGGIAIDGKHPIGAYKDMIIKSNGIIDVKYKRSFVEVLNDLASSFTASELIELSDKLSSVSIAKAVHENMVEDMNAKYEQKQKDWLFSNSDKLI